MGEVHAQVKQPLDHASGKARQGEYDNAGDKASGNLDSPFRRIGHLRQIVQLLQSWDLSFNFTAVGPVCRTEGVNLLIRDLPE
jgi:hypothetical protein